MARKDVYERYPLVFYKEDEELYMALKRVSQENRASLRATILNALEDYLGDNVPRKGNPPIKVEINNGMEGW